jgi:hypothetical protein
MTNSGFQFARPSAGGSGFTKDDHLDHPLVFVEPMAEETDHAQFGKATAARCSFIVCLQCEQTFADVLVFGAALVPALTDGNDELVVFRLGRGEARGGRSAPWLPWNPTEADLALADAYFLKHATRFPASNRISLETTKKARTEVAEEAPF